MNKKKNIVLITIDTLRRDHCSCYNYPRETTPFLDQISNNGIKFNYAFATGPLTPRSFPSILCGIMPFDEKFDDIKSYFLPKNIETIAQKMKKIGFDTVAFQAGNPFLSKYYGYNRGFDEFYDYIFDSDTKANLKDGRLKKHFQRIVMKNKFLEKNARIFLSKLDFLKKYYKILKNDIPFIRGMNLNKDIDEWLSTYKKNNPLFIWIHYMDVHPPHFPEEDLRKILGIERYSKYHLAKCWAEINNHIVKNNKQIGEIIDLYDCEVRYQDEVLEDLFHILKSHNLTEENTSFVITSDHGDEFGEHGGVGHILKLYNEMLAVPLIIYGNNIKEFSHLSNTLIELKSIPDIILDLSTDLPVNDVDKFRKDFIISESLRQNHNHNNHVRIISIQNKEFKLIFDTEDQIKNEFYNLINDGLEQENLINDKKLTTYIENMECLVREYINKDEKNKIKSLIKRKNLKI